MIKKKIIYIYNIKSCQFYVIFCTQNLNYQFFLKQIITLSRRVKKRAKKSKEQKSKYFLKVLILVNYLDS